MTLQNFNSAFKHRSLMLHFRCLLGGLGNHFGSFGSSFWEPKIVHFGSLGGPWHLEKPNPAKVQKKSSKRRPPALGVPPFSRTFLVHFSMIFRLIFLYVFGITFGAILDQFWEPKWSQNRSKIDSKFDQNFSRISEWFLDHF